MTRQDWLSVLDEAGGCGVERVQLIGGEPTMHPVAAEIVCHALGLGLAVEVFTNLVHVPARWWGLFPRPGMSIATSYYSADSAEHNAVTGRASHRLTRANIRRAIQLGARVRVGIVDAGDGRRAELAHADLVEIGVTDIKVDRVRGFGRAADGRSPKVTELCGRCGTGRAAIGPTGEVSPCAMAGWMSVGNVHDAPLAAIVSGTTMAEVTASIRSVPRSGGCDPDEECSPGVPGSSCNPRT